MTERLTLIVRSTGYRDRFDAMLDGEFVCRSRQPLMEGARELVRRGYHPDQPLTMRHHDRSYDSFLPKPIGEWAKWTIGEANRGGLERRRWQPFNHAVRPVTGGSISADKGGSARVPPQEGESSFSEAPPEDKP